MMFLHIEYKSHKCQSGASRHKQDFVKKNIKVSWKQKQLKQQLQTSEFHYKTEPTPFHLVTWQKAVSYSK